VAQKIRIEEVAREAKVSITTVSRVINKVPTVSRDNRERVEAAIRKLKFRPNISAQRLARGFSNSMGLIIPRYEGIFQSFYAMELIRGVGGACESLKMDLLLHISSGDTPLNTSNMGGIIFADIIENQKQLASATEEKLPCMVINHIVEDGSANYIAIDNKRGAQAAVEYLISLGHKTIATITGGMITQAAQHRLEGYRQALKQKGVALKENYIAKGDYSRRSARAAMEQFLKLEEPPTAVFIASDDMALEAIEVIIEKGLKVPEDISVIGFDDNPASIYGPVALTTVRQPLFHMAQLATKELNALITGKKKAAVKIILPTELVIRESCTHQ
jgi:LacI family transcriptional regulator